MPLTDAVPGVDIWRVQRGGDEDALDEDLFGDLDIGLGEEEIEETPPLLDHWYIAMIDRGVNWKLPTSCFPTTLTCWSQQRRESDQNQGRLGR